jgi:tetratricopeptide (TPR) repeat protein
MPDHSQYIMDYLTGELSPAEEKQFEARLAGDEEFQRQYQIWAKGLEYIKARNSLEEVENDPDLPRAEAEVAAWLREKDEKAASTSRQVKRFIFGTFSASVLLAAILVIRSVASPDPIRLYNKYYAPFSEEEVQMLSVRGSSDAALAAGIRFYLDENYSRAYELLQKHSGGSFFLGLSFLEMERYEDALEALEDHQKTHPDDPGVHWYLGLTQLRLGNLNRASEHLALAISFGSPHRPEAQTLRLRIEKLQSATDPQSSGRSGRHRKK